MIFEHCKKYDDLPIEYTIPCLLVDERNCGNSFTRAHTLQNDRVKRILKLEFYLHLPVFTFYAIYIHYDPLKEAPRLPIKVAYLV